MIGLSDYITEFVVSRKSNRSYGKLTPDTPLDGWLEFLEKNGRTVVTDPSRDKRPKSDEAIMTVRDTHTSLRFWVGPRIFKIYFEKGKPDPSMRMSYPKRLDNWMVQDINTAISEIYYWFSPVTEHVISRSNSRKRRITEESTFDDWLGLLKSVGFKDTEESSYMLDPKKGEVFVSTERDGWYQIDSLEFYLDSEKYLAIFRDGKFEAMYYDDKKLRKWKDMENELAIKTINTLI